MSKITIEIEVKGVPAIMIKPLQTIIENEITKQMRGMEDKVQVKSTITD